MDGGGGGFVDWIFKGRGGRERKKEGCPVQNVPYSMALWTSPLFYLNAINCSALIAACPCVRSFCYSSSGGD